MEHFWSVKSWQTCFASLWAAKGCLTSHKCVLLCSQLHPYLLRYISSRVLKSTQDFLQQICPTISGLIYSSRSWEEWRLLINPLPTIYDPAHYSKCHNYAILFVCKELWRNTAVPWPSRSTLSMLEPLFKTKKVSCMKHSQNKSSLKEFTNTLSREKQFWFSCLSGVSILCAQDKLHSKMRDLLFPQVCWEANWKHLRNKTKEPYMERLKGRRNTTEKHTCN